MKDFDDAIQSAARLARWFVREERRQPQMPYVGPKELARRIDLPIEAEGISGDELFRILEAVLRFTPKTASPKFVNQLFGGLNLPAVCAEMLTGVLNSSMYTFKAAGPHVLIEMEVVGRMLGFVGFENGEGVLLPGGSVCNLAAMVLARDRFDDSRDRGVRQPFVAYTSTESHYSLVKNAGIIGIGRDNLREIETDDRGRMVVAQLERRIAADRREGRLPFFVNATAGTTVRGSFDQLEAIADVARREGLWLHVDGALGGAALLSAKHRHLLAGCALADSFSWNAHKLMGVPLSCSALLVRRRGSLFASFAEHADYLFQTEADEYNLGNISLQCGKKNDALKIWAAWKYYGDRGYEERIDRIFALARYATDFIQRHSRLELACPTESVAVCFDVSGADPVEICNRLDADGVLKVGYGSIGALRAIRLACVNPDLTDADIDAFFEDVLRMADRIDSVSVTV